MKKIRFYKNLLVELIETLCTICLYLDFDGHVSRNRYSEYMIPHFKELKKYSAELRGDRK